jgi:hypothetical protein
VVEREHIYLDPKVPQDPLDPQVPKAIPDPLDLRVSLELTVCRV